MFSEDVQDESPPHIMDSMPQNVSVENAKNAGASKAEGYEATNEPTANNNMVASKYQPSTPANETEGDGIPSVSINATIPHVEQGPNSIDRPQEEKGLSNHYDLSVIVFFIILLAFQLCTSTAIVVIFLKSHQKSLTKFRRSRTPSYRQIHQWVQLGT